MLTEQQGGAWSAGKMKIMVIEEEKEKEREKEEEKDKEKDEGGKILSKGGA